MINSKTLKILFFVAIAPLSGFAYGEKISAPKGWQDDPNYICSKLTPAYCKNTAMLKTRLQKINSENKGKYCAKEYKPMFADQKLSVVIALGYSDGMLDDATEPFAFDYGDGLGLRATLLQPCEKGVSICGFVSSPLKPNVLEKRGLLAPDGTKYDVELFLSATAVSPKNVDNVNKYADAQNARSTWMQNIFDAALGAGNDVVLYAGHSRYGGGMDFYPRVKKSNLPRGFTFRKKAEYFTELNGEHIGKRFVSVLDKLKNAQKIGKAPKLFGSLSCNSKEHFYEKLKSTLPNSGFILSTDDMGTNDDTLSTIVALNSVMEMSCADTFAKGFKAAHFSKYAGMLKVFDFFSP